MNFHTQLIEKKDTYQRAFVMVDGPIEKANVLNAWMNDNDGFAIIDLLWQSGNTFYILTLITHILVAYPPFAKLYWGDDPTDFLGDAPTVMKQLMHKYFPHANDLLRRTLDLALEYYLESEQFKSMDTDTFFLWCKILQTKLQRMLKDHPNSVVVRGKSGHFYDVHMYTNYETMEEVCTVYQAHTSVSTMHFLEYVTRLIHEYPNLHHSAYRDSGMRWGMVSDNGRFEGESISIPLLLNYVPYGEIVEVSACEKLFWGIEDDYVVVDLTEQGFADVYMGDDPDDLEEHESEE